MVMTAKLNDFAKLSEDRPHTVYYRYNDETYKKLKKAKSETLEPVNSWYIWSTHIDEGSQANAMRNVVHHPTFEFSKDIL